MQSSFSEPYTDTTCCLLCRLEWQKKRQRTHGHADAPEPKDEPPSDGAGPGGTSEDKSDTTCTRQKGDNKRKKHYSRDVARDGEGKQNDTTEAEPVPSSDTASKRSKAGTPERRSLSKKSKMPKASRDRSELPKKPTSSGRDSFPGARPVRPLELTDISLSDRTRQRRMMEHMIQELTNLPSASLTLPLHPISRY